MVNEYENRADVVIFGASGFTGERVVRVAMRKQQEDPEFTFKVAGRSINKLREVLERCKEVTGETFRLRAGIFRTDSNYFFQELRISKLSWCRQI